MMQTYPYSIFYNNKVLTLCWVSPVQGHDFFLKNDDGLIVLPEFSSGLLSNFGDDYHVSDEKSDFYFDEFLGVTNSIFLSNFGCDGLGSSDYELVLNGFNLLEDLTFTFNKNYMLEVFRDKFFLKILDKLFFANNLQSITPSGKEYLPIWNKDELKLMENVRDMILKYLVLSDKQLLDFFSDN